MKIAYISNSIIPSRTANSIHVMKMCQSLSDNGYEVVLYAPAHLNIEPDVEDIYEYYGVRNNFQVKKIPLKKIKGKTLIYGYEVAKHIREDNPDIVYGRYLIGCFLSTLINKQKVIFEAHKPIEYDGMMQQFIFKRLIKRNNFYRLITITEALKKQISDKYNIPDNKVIVAHDGADIPSNELTPISLKVSNKRNINVGYVGQLYSGKGMELISELAKLCPWANFHIVGGIEKDINFWKNQLKNIDNIYFYGFLPHSETARYIKACDILLAPYQTVVKGHGKKNSNLAQWMSPLKIFEYMSLEKAIICSDLPVLREVLQDGVNSLLCDPENLQAWVKSLKLLSENEKKRKIIASNAYKDFRERYTWNSRAQLILNSHE